MYVHWVDVVDDVARWMRRRVAVNETVLLLLLLLLLLYVAVCWCQTRSRSHVTGDVHWSSSAAAVERVFVLARVFVVAGVVAARRECRHAVRYAGNRQQRDVPLQYWAAFFADWCQL